MKKSVLFLTVLLAASLPLTVQGAAGYLYEPDTSADSIFQFTTTASGTLLKTTFASGLTGLRGVAFDRAGNLFAAQEDRIIRITPGGFTSIFASDLHGPNFLAFDPAGNLYASDRDGNVVRFNPQGAGSVFVSGLEKPTGVAFDFAGNLFVADIATNAIYKVTPSKVKSTFAQGLNGPQGLTFDRFGILYVANSLAGTVEAFTPVGSRFTRIFNLTSPMSVAFQTIAMPDASPSPSPTPFVSPSPAATPAPQDPLFVADGCGTTSTIQKFDGTSETGEIFASDVGCPLQLAFEPARDPLLNISTRARVEPGVNRELIGGFIVTGKVPKTVLIRAIGPSLTKSGVTQPLQDPTLELHTPGGVIGNDNWMDSQKEDIQATGLAPKDNLESAILVTLDPGAYTAVVRGKPPFQDGVALVEVYDLNLAADSTLANISTRAFVQTNQNVLIAGFIVGGGNGAGKVIVRALGPSLTQASVTGVLPDPKVSLFNANGNQLAFNDDWADTQATEIESTGIAPPNSLESAIVATLTTGAYTAIVEDFNGNSGVGLIEVYNIR
jgi:hypothetical protein